MNHLNFALCHWYLVLQKLVGHPAPKLGLTLLNHDIWMQAEEVESLMNFVYLLSRLELLLQEHYQL